MNKRTQTKLSKNGKKIQDLEEENKLLKEQLLVLGLRQHGQCMGYGYNSAKLVEGRREKMIEDWKTCKMSYCQRLYHLIFGNESIPT